MIYNQVVYDVFAEAVASMSVPGYTINFEAGNDYNIIKSLIEKDNAPTLQALKYPLVAVVMPIREFYNNGLQRILANRIIIAHLTNQDIGVEQRYDPSEVFKTILYPCYYEFLKRLAWSTKTNGQDPFSISHSKVDYPSRQPIGKGLQDYVDIIELNELELFLN